MSSLPSEYTPELWTEWTACECGKARCNTIERTLASGNHVGVLFDSSGFYWMCKETYEGVIVALPEAQCLESVNSYAEQKGGWDGL